MRFILSDIDMASQVVLEMQFQLGGRDQCQSQSGNGMRCDVVRCNRLN